MRIRSIAIASALMCPLLLAQGCTRSACTAEQGSVSAGAGVADQEDADDQEVVDAPAGQPEAAGQPVEAPGSEAASPSAEHMDPASGEGAPAAVAANKGCKSVSSRLPMAERCAKAGARVHTFPNTCAGRCSAIEKGMFCGQAMTDGCRCPQGQCIDDETGCCRGIRR